MSENKRKLVMAGKRLKVDGRAMRGVDPDVLALFKQVLTMYGTNGTKIILTSIVNGKLQPKF